MEGTSGVVTQYKFRLAKVNKITLIQLEWDNNKTARLEFLRTWQDWLIGLDRRISALWRNIQTGGLAELVFLREAGGSCGNIGTSAKYTGDNPEDH